MQLEHIVVATDETDAGRSAARMGLDLAHRAAARLTFLTVIPAEPAPALVGSGAGSGGGAARRNELVITACDRLAAWLESELVREPSVPTPDIGAAFGIPGIEICRFAEDRRADLLVLGRKPRTRAARLLLGDTADAVARGCHLVAFPEMVLLGDTADAVARRSLVPSLYVPPGTGPIRRMLVALDGSERGMIVFRRACLIAAAIGATLAIVTVEPSYASEPESLAEALPTTRSQALIDRVAAQAAADKLACLDHHAGNGATPGLVAIRRGDVVAQVLAAVEATGADVLAVGYHRGGPPGSIEGGSIARRLAHQAPCAFLAVPL
jgi:nucleotide-binding universal stress UspA family protein